jgi:hypothetical protein
MRQQVGKQKKIGLRDVDTFYILGRNPLVVRMEWNGFSEVCPESVLRQRFSPKVCEWVSEAKDRGL